MYSSCEVLQTLKARKWGKKGAPLMQNRAKCFIYFSSYTQHSIDPDHLSLWLTLLNTYFGSKSKWAWKDFFEKVLRVNQSETTKFSQNCESKLVTYEFPIFCQWLEKMKQLSLLFFIISLDDQGLATIAL